MSLDATTAEFMKLIVHNNYLYRVPGCFRVSKTMAIGDLMFKLINNSFNDTI